jgi:hypothetical protein
MIPDDPLEEADRLPLLLHRFQGNRRFQEGDRAEVREIVGEGNDQQGGARLGVPPLGEAAPADLELGPGRRFAGGPGVLAVTCA